MFFLSKLSYSSLTFSQSSDPLIPAYTFSYQRDTYTYSPSPPSFEPLPYPSSSKPPISTYQSLTSGLPSASVTSLSTLYGKNEFNIPIPTFSALFMEHATAPFFVFQIFCVALWCLDEYWYYSLFTLFMLVVFECTLVFQVSSVSSVYFKADGADRIYYSVLKR